MNPQRRFERNEGKGNRLSLKPKAINVEDLAAKVDHRKWRRITIRDSTPGPHKVESLHLNVWVLDEEKRRRLQRLIVRRDRTEKHKRHKYTLNNEPMEVPAQKLAFMQAQRFWVEHGIKECKHQLGMGEYQVRLWRRHHHVTKVLLLGLFMLETRLKHGTDIPLLSAEDIRYILEPLLPRITLQDVIRHIQKRHRQRAASMPHFRHLE